MGQQILGLVDAVQAAIEAEQKAAAFYADAVTKTANPIGQKLFGQLSEFEEGHVRALSALKKTLLDGGEDVPYDGGELRIPTPAAMVGAAEPNRLSVMAILELAIETETKAYLRYRDLARQVSHPRCRAMFERLAAEERSHLDLMERSYDSLNDRGEWDWLGTPRDRSGC